jgi:hypothetical protein
LVAAALVAVPTAALAAPPAAAPVGYDVSYPQCGKALPTSPAFGIVGVNDGIAYSANPCLATQYAWALRSSSTSQAKVQFYANTGNPGPQVSTHWPTGQQTPRVCAGAWDADCSYDYGWNAAQDSFKDASAATSFGAASNAPWWLDVESANSWSADQSTNGSAIQGAVDFLKANVLSVGLYSNASSWSSIVGSTTVFASLPSWVPGARTEKAAKANCGVTITGGPAKYAQYASGGLDADYACS